MKNIIKVISIALLPLIMSCGNGQGTETKSDDATKEEQHEAMAPGTKMDPVCEMPFEAGWTEFSVHKNDTVWFCSEGCKQAFDARPEKYMGKG